MRQTKRTLAIVALTTLVGCSNPTTPAFTPSPSPVILNIHATTAARPLLTEASHQYRVLNPTVSFDMAFGNYQVLLDRLLNGEIAYFISSHLPWDSELWAAPIAYDGIAILVNPANNITNLSADTIRRIYQGQITDWSAIGGDAGVVIVVSREAGSGTRAEFEQAIMGDRRTTPNARLALSSEAMVETVASIPGSIGYVSLSQVDDRVRAVQVDGVEPTLSHVSTNRYPLRSIVFIVGLSEPDGAYRTFFGWLQGIEGQSMIAPLYAPLFTLSEN